MSDIFWISGSSCNNGPIDLAAALSQVGILPAWIEIAHLMADDIEQAKEITPYTFPATFLWIRQKILPGFIFHDVCRALLIREQNLALLAGKDKIGVHYTLLASPQAVGRYNLMPHAHITAWWALPSSAINALPQKLEKSGFDPSVVGWIVGEGDLGQNAIAVFPAAKPIEGTSDSIIGKLNCLIRHLDQTKCSHGLLLTGSAGSPLLATLIER